MSSTNKTSLGLNMWEASDKPVRQDFVNDNTIIDDKITQLNSNLASKIGIGDVTGNNMEYPIVFGGGDGFAATSGIALPYSSRYNVIITGVKIKDTAVDYSKWQLHMGPNSFSIYTNDSSLASSAPGKYGYVNVSISLK
jgi:hypothetical protein